MWVLLSNSDDLDRDEQLFAGLMYTFSECQAQTSQGNCASVTSAVFNTTTIVAGSLQLTTSSENSATICLEANLASDGDTWVAFVTALETGNVSMTGVSVGPLTCRSLGDDTLLLAFAATCSDLYTASSFSDEVSEHAAAVQSEFETLVASTFNVTVSATFGDLSITTEGDGEGVSGGATGGGALLGASVLAATVLLG
jgi:hypothetical protein